MKDRIAKSVFWLVWSRGVVQVISFLSALVVARLLSPADYGLMALAGIWTYSLSLLADLGLGPAIVQFRDLDERELNVCFWLTMAVAVGGYLALYASAPWIAAWFANPLLGRILRVAGLSLPLLAARLVPDSLLRKRLELPRVAQAETAAVIATVPVVLGLAWSGAGVWALVTGTLVTPLVQNAVTFWFVRWRPGLGVGSRRLRDILRYGLASLGARISWAAYQQVDTAILGKVAGDVALGFYAMAKLIANLPVDKISVAANQLALPILAGLQTDRAAMRASFLRGLRLTSCLTVPLCAGMALVADDLVSAALGPKWMPAVPLVRVLCLFGLIRSLDVLLPPVLFARYRAAFLFWWTVGLLLVMPFAFWAGAMWLGALGVALAALVVYPIIMLPMARRVLGELDTGWKTIWDQVRPVITPTAIMVGVVLAVRWAIPGADGGDRLARLGIACGLGGSVYALGILWWGGPLRREIVEVLGWLLPRGRLTTAKTNG